MREVTMLEFRRDAEGVLAKVRNGERLILTHRGKPVARLEPILDVNPDSEDPFYSLTDLAETGQSLSNTQMDEVIYGP